MKEQELIFPTIGDSDLDLVNLFVQILLDCDASKMVQPTAECL
jgi:hypothetical protein